MTNLIPVETEQNVKKDIALLSTQAQTLIVQDEVTFAGAADFLSKVKVRIKRLDSMKEDLTRPFADALKEARNKFKMMSEPYEQMEASLKSKMNAYIQLKEAQAQKEAYEAKLKADEENNRRIIEQQRAEAKGEPVKEVELVEATPVEAPKTQVRTESGVTYVTKKWKARITDEKIVPREYLGVDQVKVNDAIKSGVREIPGIEIFEESTVAVRT